MATNLLMCRRGHYIILSILEFPTCLAVFLSMLVYIVINSINQPIKICVLTSALAKAENWRQLKKKLIKSIILLSKWSIMDAHIKVTISEKN